MPQQLLLEGTDLEALMVRARDEYGPGVRVVRAEKVRSGGFLGFFSREHFELTVEISDADIAKAALTRAPVEVITSRAAAEAALAAEIADAQAARESMLAGTLADFGSDRFGEVGSGPSALPSTRFDEDAPLVAGRFMSRPAATDSAEFDRLVLQLTEAAVVADASPSAAAPSAAPAIAAPAHAPQSAHAPSIVRPFVPAVFPVAHRVSPTGTIVEDEASPVVPSSAGDASRPHSDQGSSSPQRPDRPQRLEGVVLHRWGVFTDVASAVATHCTVPALLALGVPLRCIEELADLGAPVPLLDVVARFGTPPVRRPEPGDLIVVAGPASDALAVASQLAAWVGLPATAVVLAGEIDAIRGHGRRIRDEVQARALRARAEKVATFGEPLIVALGVGPGRRGAAAAAPMLAALNADTAWAVVDATKRPSAYEPSVALLAKGSRVDGLAAVNVSDAQAPCAMLDASLPVAWMDGLPAAGVVWAALLGERIAALD